MNGTRRIVIGLAAALGLAFAATAQACPGGGMGPGYGGMGNGHGAMGHGHGAMGQGHGMGGGPGACAQGEGGAGFCGARGAGPGFERGNPGAVSEGRLEYLKSQLAITTAQEKAWNAYAAAVRARAAEGQAFRGKAAEAGATATAPERFALRAEVMKQRVAGMEAMAVAVKDLYAVLTPGQKAIADERLARGGPGRMAFAGGGWR